MSTHSIRDIWDAAGELGRPIAFYPSFTAITGSVTATLFLCQLRYWTPRAHDEDGWIYKTRDEWTRELGLSRREQETARKRLRDLGILEERLVGMPAHTEYRVVPERFNQLWAEHQSVVQLGGMRPTSRAQSAQQVGTNPPYPIHITESTSETTAMPAQPATPDPSDTAPSDQGNDAPSHAAVFEAIMLACGYDRTKLTKTQQGRIAQAAGELRKVSCSLYEIEQFPKWWAQKFPEAEMTPQSMTKHWATYHRDLLRRDARAARRSARPLSNE